MDVGVPQATVLAVMRENAQLRAENAQLRAEKARLWAVVESHVTHGTATKTRVAPAATTMEQLAYEQLSERALEVLQSLDELEAYSQDSAVTYDDLAHRAGGSRSHVGDVVRGVLQVGVKLPVAACGNNEKGQSPALVCTCSGKKNGTWLLDFGRRVLALHAKNHAEKGVSPINPLRIATNAG
jgi:hypothetical protein